MGDCLGAGSINPITVRQLDAVHEDYEDRERLELLFSLSQIMYENNEKYF